MQTFLFESLRALAALAAGAAIGAAFGSLQAAAVRRNETRQQAGRLKNGWTLFPGSGARIAYLLIALALVQLLCPMLFAEGTQWVVSAGVLAGYGWMLFQQLRQRLKASPR
jgi:hypothetical protein